MWSEQVTQWQVPSAANASQSRQGMGAEPHKALGGDAQSLFREDENVRSNESPDRSFDV